MNLTLEPEVTTWPETHYVFVERSGPFQKAAPDAWTTAHSLAPRVKEHNQIAGYMTLYKIGPKVYRAGFSLAAPPKELPEGLTYEKFAGGKYSRFVLTGPYDNLPAASGRVWEIVAEKAIPVRDDFSIEHYITDPNFTPPDQLLTEILVPTA
ncbi:MAG: GyrI-like domain-containing protein [Terracidiphilus sp.]|jgi:effector-binding domain-containing protein